MLALRIHHGALEEIEKTVARYEDAQSGLGRRFFRSVREAMERAQTQPNKGKPILDGTYRQWEVRHRFPYRVCYRVYSDHVFITAVVHTSRRQGYWLDRVDPPAQP